jgi:hypothetical protein
MAMVVVVATLTTGIMVVKADQQMVAITISTVEAAQWATAQTTNTMEAVVTGEVDVEELTCTNEVITNQKH